MTLTPNQNFLHQWIDQKVAKILNKIGKEKISTEEMIILSLNAQAQYSHKMNIELSNELKAIKDKLNIHSQHANP